MHIAARSCLRRKEPNVIQQTKKTGFVKSVAKGTAKGLGDLAKGATIGVARELASILSLGLYKPRRRR